MAVQTTEQVRWWQDKADLRAHIEDWLACETPMLQYDLDTATYRHRSIAGRELVVPCALFEQAREAYIQVRKLKPVNFQQATEAMLHVWRWKCVDGELRYNIGRARHG